MMIFCKITYDTGESVYYEKVGNEIVKVVDNSLTTVTLQDK